MFPDELRDELPQTAIHDWREAGRCLVLGSPTACGFHILRAVEAVIGSYYELIGEPPPTRMRNWGVYIRKLRESGRADDKITDFMDHTRDNYRNPVSHPEVFMNMDEAGVLIGVAASCIRQMVLATKEIKKDQEDKQPTLPRTLLPAGSL
jgi:hypothetical protein